MTVDRAVQDLEENGSAEDPIFYRDHETTPSRLEHMFEQNPFCSASYIRIGYYGGRDLHLIKRGTLSGMVADRRRLQERLRERLTEDPKQRSVRAILKDLIIAFDLEFAKDGHVSCMAFPKEVRELAAEAHRKLKL